IADNGKPGGTANKHGKSAADEIVRVPVGTVVLDMEGSEFGDLDSSGALLNAARGGHGGRGNARFATASHRAPTEFEPGLPGETKKLKLQLRLLADVGIIGFPNAGKSTLLKALCGVNVKIANYPFTTRDPNLGVLRGESGEEVVMADIPGILEGAHSGKGLGAEFLKHALRTRLILYLLEARDEPADALLAGCERQWSILHDELEAYSPALVEKESIRVVNKMDLVTSRRKFREEAQVRDYFPVSALTGQGLPALKERLLSLFLRPVGGSAAR
ncbi:MAG: GTPase, partial [bacterium]